MKLLESGEMYLETIYILAEKGQAVRSIDICERMGFSKPSISRAMGILKSEGFILMDKNGYISLTEKGRNIAEKIYERHTILTKFLESFGVGRETATADACKIEHDLSDETFEALKKYVNQK